MFGSLASYSIWGLTFIEYPLGAWYSVLSPLSGPFIESFQSVWEIIVAIPISVVKSNILVVQEKHTSGRC